MSDIGKKLIDAVRDAAAGNPEYIYDRHGTSCAYVRDGQPSCIVGKAAWNLGLINAEFEYSTNNTGGVEELAQELDLDIDEPELRWLMEAQDQQDGGTPWGRVPSYADGETRDYDPDDDE